MATDEQALLLRVSADVTKLEKQFQKAVAAVDGGSDRMERRAAQMAERVSKHAAEVDPAKALTKVFDSSRLAVLEEGGAKLRVFGSALEPLGPAGIAAAVGVIAVTEALSQAKEAAEFADKIEDTAKKLHVTTDALQEYRYAVFAAGGTQEGADQALEAFSVNLGKAQEGLKKSQRAFLALGFTPAQIKSFTDVDGALKAVTERINQLQNNPQRDALIDQLGLTGMKPLILEGVSAMEELRVKAHEIGIVMDADLVKKGADANKQFEVLSQVIDVQLKSAFVDLAPVLVTILTFAAGIAKEIANVVESLTAIENRSRGQLQRSIDALDAGIAKDSELKAAHPNDPFFAAAANARINRAFEERARLSAQLDKLGPAQDETPPVPSGTRTLSAQGGRGGAATPIKPPRSRRLPSAFWMRPTRRQLRR
jgi:hypothetical protein